MFFYLFIQPSDLSSICILLSHAETYVSTVIYTQRIVCCRNILGMQNLVGHVSNMEAVEEKKRPGKRTSGCETDDKKDIAKERYVGYRNRQEEKLGRNEEGIGVRILVQSAMFTSRCVGYISPIPVDGQKCTRRHLQVFLHLSFVDLRSSS